MSEEKEKAAFDYIELLEKTNENLLATLRQCMMLLRECRPERTDPAEWEDLLEMLRETIEAGEKVLGEKGV